MSDTTTTRFRLSRMLPRDPDQPHRAASSLELFFDLVFVVAVSIASADLHHQLAEGHLANGILTYVLVFFGIWWAWMNFTWFATSFDNDDWLYRVMTIVQMSGVLVLAAGIGPAYESGDYVVLVLGYVIMRVAMISQWLRAARANPDYRRTALFYAVGIGIAQVLWLLFLLLPSAWQMPVFFVLAGAELAVPVIAESQNKTPWHPHHITERYSLFTLIVLGETILASANAVIGALDKVESTWSLISIAALTLISAASMWWIYFWPPHHRAITTLRGSIRYGYVHYFVLAAAAAFSVGIELQIDMLTKPGEAEPLVAAFAVAIPIAVFLLAIWWIAIRANADRLVNIVVPGGAVLVLVDAVLPLPVALTTVILVAVVVVLVIRQPVRR
ncbi:low temperature requirement protein A [Microbacterium sp. NPDC057659]|uniref:low temperature requirement protein A n=1 Tax=Microbacterium sp. NPDC057659 TaxID=3346198 RepID=UPI003672E671